jgi:hypothetical protein
MATRIKSNFTTTNANAPKFSEIGYTAQDRLDIYSAAVVADGGEIIDSAATLAAIEYAMEARILSRMTVMASPSWGVKKTAGRYDKLYSLFGTDLEGVTVGGGSKPLSDTDAAGNPIAITDINASRVGGLFQTTADVTVAENADDWFVPVGGSISALDALTAQLAFGNVALGGTGFIPASVSRTATLNSYSGQRSDYDPNAASDATKRISGSVTNTGIADPVGIALLMKVSTGEIKLIVDGDVKASVVSSTGALYAYQTLARRIRAGGAYDASANITSNRKAQIREVFSIGRTTEAAVLALTSEISSRYA